MKKITTTLFTALIATSLFAQNTDKGKIVGNGAIGLDLGSSKVSSQTTINGVAGPEITLPGNTNFAFGMTPALGYFIIKNFAMGLKMRYDVSNSKDASDTVFTTKINTASFTVGPFIRYYYNMGKIAPFGELSFGLGNVNSKKITDFTNKNLTDITNSTKAKGNVFGFGAGLAIFLNEKVGIESMLSYNILRRVDESPITNGTIQYKNSAGNLMFNMGISMYL